MTLSRLPASLFLSPIVLVLFLPHSICHPSLEIKNTPLSGILFFAISFSQHGAEFYCRNTTCTGLQDGLVLPRRFVAEVPPPGNLTVDNSSFILAAARTHRKDPLNGYKRYTGGWNISEKHYWAVSPFASPMPGKFHSSTYKTLDYVVGQANFTVDNLRNFSENLAEAKKIKVDRVFLPTNVQGEIDALEAKVNSSANDLASQTSDNSRKISRVLDRVRLYMIIIAAVMLLLAFLGFCKHLNLEQNLKNFVWKGYVCQTVVVSGSEVCATIGRVTPSIYNQMMAAVTVSRGLYYYVPFLTGLEDCSFVRETFTAIHKNNCPGLEQNSKLVFIGLVMVSAAVMLSLVFWVIYAMERSRPKFNKLFLP
ncbi:hypothetical protein B296_00016354 [Ensete ventricosum]|uniref:Uncharacterized protein n=1 Tax=Ensete ventricosum TaxID=4639 RepID=A0A426YMX3_ENSVE|nr:hypothetical protein B296_00016354 [Ensete ventricosum]